MAVPRVDVERTGLVLTLGVVFSIGVHAVLFSPKLISLLNGGSTVRPVLVNKSAKPKAPPKQLAPKDEAKKEAERKKEEEKKDPSSPKPPEAQEEPKPEEQEKQEQEKEEPKPPEERAPRPPVQPQPAYPDDEEVTLGSDEGDPNSIVIIGRDAYEEHLARLSQVDQAAYRMSDAGGGGDPDFGRTDHGRGEGGGGGAPNTPVTVAANTEGAPQLPAPTPEPVPVPVPVPTPVPAPLPTPAPVTPAVPEPKPQDTPPLPLPAPPVPPESDVPDAPSPDELKPTPPPITPPLPTSPNPTPPTPTPPEQTPPVAPPVTPPVVQPLPPVVPPPLPANPQAPPTAEGGGVTSPVKPADGPANAAPGDAGKGGSPNGTAPVPGTGGEGAVSNLESPASSLIEARPEDWRNGKLIPGKGISLQTRRPIFPLLTRITERGRSPLVTIWFNKEGVCTKAVMNISTGSEDLDGPIQDSLYRWRASGQRIRELQGNQTVKVELRLLL